MDRCHHYTLENANISSISINTISLMSKVQQGYNNKTTMLLFSQTNVSFLNQLGDMSLRIVFKMGIFSN